MKYFRESLRAVEISTEYIYWISYFFSYHFLLQLRWQGRYQNYIELNWRKFPVSEILVSLNESAAIHSHA